MAKYQITISANLPQEWHSRIADLSVGVEVADSQYRIVTVDLKSEAALMQLLNEIHGHGIELVSLRRLSNGTHVPAQKSTSVFHSH
jgi:hypothetical protein